MEIESEHDGCIYVKIDLSTIGELCIASDNHLFPVFDEETNTFKDKTTLELKEGDKLINLIQGNDVDKKAKLWMFTIIGTEKITKYDKEYIYCLEMEDKTNPYFCLADGTLVGNCRLRLDKTKIHAKGGGQFGASGLTGSVGVCTINLNRIGYEAKTKEEFYEILEKRMEIAGKSLKFKRDLIEQKTEEGLYPYCKFYLRNVYMRHKKYWANHFSTIGLIGGNEACLNLLGKNIASEEGNQFMCDVLKFMNNKLLDLQNKFDCYMNLEQTPGEGCSRSLALKDRKYAGKDIIIAGTEDHPYITNSTQLPVNYTDDLFEVLDLQNDLAKQYTGGSVVHLWIGENITDHSALKRLVKKICETYNMPYFTFTPSFSICPVHGYLSGEHEYCYKCDEEILNGKRKM